MRKRPPPSDEGGGVERVILACPKGAGRTEGSPARPAGRHEGTGAPFHYRPDEGAAVGKQVSGVGCQPSAFRIRALSAGRGVVPEVAAAAEAASQRQDEPRRGARGCRGPSPEGPRKDNEPVVARSPRVPHLSLRGARRRRSNLGQRRLVFDGPRVRTEAWCPRLPRPLRRPRKDNQAVMAAATRIEIPRRGKSFRS